MSVVEGPKFLIDGCAHMWLTLPSANYLPLNLLKHMGLGVTFAQETLVDIICSTGLTFFPP